LIDEASAWLPGACFILRKPINKGNMSLESFTGFQRYPSLKNESCYNHVMSIPDSVELLRLLVSRLERLSVDSRWARRASGLRGNIIKVLEEADAGQVISSDRLDLLINRSFEILRKAAKEIPDIDEIVKKFGHV
jgi:hypothetical protein